jgi:hypothetical protein
MRPRILSRGCICKREASEGSAGRARPTLSVTGRTDELFATYRARPWPSGRIMMCDTYPMPCRRQGCPKSEAKMPLFIGHGQLHE